MSKKKKGKREQQTPVAGESTATLVESPPPQTVETETPVKEPEKKKDKDDPQIIPYTQLDETPQVVRPFKEGEIESENAHACLVIVCHLLSVSKEKFITDADVNRVVLEQTDTDLSKYYTGSAWAGSPIHKGLYSLSKAETPKADVNKEGAKTDKYARGARGILLREGRCGLHSKGRYFKNTDPSHRKWFKAPSPEELKQNAYRLVMNSTPGKKLQQEMKAKKEETSTT